jgi:Trk K+ transport system NAD-binding subunit
MLRQHGETVRFLGSDPIITNQTTLPDSETIPGQSIPGSLETAVQQGPIQALLVLSAEDTRNLLVCYAARRLRIEPIVALMNDPARLTEYRALGVHIFNPSLYRANMFVILARNPALFSLLTSTTDQQDVREVLLRNPLYAGSVIKNVSLPGNITIVAISRNGEFLVPHGYTRLEQGDRITLFGGTEEIQRLAERLESQRAT